jgi:uncharacterized NAD(P)/FAD-binding protein YdhS
MLVWLHDRAAGFEKWIGGRYVVNCTGPECNYQKLKEPLLVNLFGRGLAHPDPLFQGLVTNRRGALINYLGQISPNLFTLGSPRRGGLLETTAVPELRVQAEKLALELAYSELQQAVKNRAIEPGSAFSMARAN